MKKLFISILASASILFAGPTNSQKEPNSNPPQLKFVNDGSEAASSFFAGQDVMKQMQQINLKGTEKQKAEQINNMASLMEKAMSYYSAAASKSKKWELSALIQMGNL